MKIIFWAGNIGNKYGAYEKYILRFAQKCHELHHELYIVHEFENTVPEYRNGLINEKAEYILAPNSISNPQASLPFAYRLVRKVKPDIFYAHFSSPLLLIIARIAGALVVYRVCGTGLGYKISIRTHITRRLTNYFIDRYLVVSERVRDEEIAVGVDKKKVFLNYIGIPPSLYEDNPNLQLPTPYSNDDNVKKIITVGRFSPEKGMRFITDLAVELLKNREDLIWWLVGGEGSDLSYCQTMIQVSNMLDKVFILGERNDVPALFLRSYIQVVGSLFEGLPLGILEASFYRVPTIGPNIRGINEAVYNYHTGLLAQQNSQPEFMAAINLLLDNREMRMNMGDNAKCYVSTKYNSDDKISELFSFMEKDISDRKQTIQNKSLKH